MLATGPRTDNINPYNAMKRWSVEATDSMIHLMCGYVYDWCPWLLSMLVKGWQDFFNEVINCSDGLIPEVTGAFSVMFSPFPLVSVSLFFCSSDCFFFFFLPINLSHSQCSDGCTQMWQTAARQWLTHQAGSFGRTKISVVKMWLFAKQIFDDVNKREAV